LASHWKQPNAQTPKYQNTQFTLDGIHPVGYFIFQAGWSFSVGAPFQPRRSMLKAIPTENLLADIVALRAMACL
jgi:hypothetical protein